MEKYFDYLIPVLVFALLAAGWMAVQLIAKKTGTKNHIDNVGSCCGSCQKKDECSKAESSV